MSKQEENIITERVKITELLLKIDDLWVLEMIYKCIENVIKEQRK